MAKDKREPKPFDLRDLRSAGAQRHRVIISANRRWVRIFPKPAASPPPRQEKTPKRRRSQTKLDRVKAVMRELWPSGVPEEMTTPKLLHQLAPELKRRKTDASDDTVKRALGRR